MAFKVLITRDFDHLSELAAAIIVADIKDKLQKKENYVIGLATGNTPTGLYKHLAKAANADEFNPAMITSFNLDEYIGLPGENSQQRALHPESYSYFMVRELFGLMEKSFAETEVPWGTLVEQVRFAKELEDHPEDWELRGADKGKALQIKEDAHSEYLSWIRREILGGYREKIKQGGGIDLHVVGVGGRGHVGFHEAGIPFENNEMLLVKLDDNTVANAVEDGHFTGEEESPRYAVTMGASLIYQAGTVLLLANGSRKAEPVAESLLMEPDCSVPISYGQISHREGRNVIYILDLAAAAKVLDNVEKLRERGIEVEDRSNEKAARRVEELTFRRDPETGLMG